jgi:hypothetical protein
VVAATVTRSSGAFLALAGVLGWSALRPALNPFDALVRLLSRDPTVPSVPEAPPPRRFAQVLGGGVAALVGLALREGWHGVAYGAETFLFLGASATAFGRLCFGAFLYFLLRGKLRFALRTLPWGGGV